MNPDWHVELLDDARARVLSTSYDRFSQKDGLGMALLSDLLRLDLLNEYGGVWADVSVCPVHPLQSYIDEKLSPVGFYVPWLNHWPTAGDAQNCERNCWDKDSTYCNSRVTVTWFMAASGPNNVVIHAWHRALNDRASQIEKGTNHYPYYLVHCVFNQVVQKNKHVSKRLQLMPKDLPAGDAGWAWAFSLDPEDPERLFDKFHRGCPKDGQREHLPQKWEPKDGKGKRWGRGPRNARRGRSAEPPPTRRKTGSHGPPGTSAPKRARKQRRTAPLSAPGSARGP